jgi:hypothetical protein
MLRHLANKVGKIIKSKASKQSDIIPKPTFYENDLAMRNIADVVSPSPSDRSPWKKGAILLFCPSHETI